MDDILWKQRFQNFEKVYNIITFTGKKKIQINKPDKSEYPGQLQYFYSSPDSYLPVRDVENKQNAGFKTEPHIEIGAENFLKSCSQAKIRGAINRGAENLFLLTKCTNKQLKKFFGNQYIVGYIRNNEVLNTKSTQEEYLQCIKGDVKIVSYEDAVPIKELYGQNLSRSGISKFGKVDETTSEKILGKLKNKKDITDKCIDEIIKLDKNNLTCKGKSCEFCQQCKRGQNLI